MKSKYIRRSGNPFANTSGKLSLPNIGDRGDLDWNALTNVDFAHGHDEYQREFTADTHILMANILEPNDIGYGNNDEEDSFLEHQRSRDFVRNQDSQKHWEKKNLLLNEEQLTKYVEDYKKIERLDEFQQASPVHKRDPIVSYLNKLTQKNHPPHKLPFAKGVKEDDDVESVVSERRGLGVKSYYINPTFAGAFSENLRYNRNLHSLALSNTKLVDSTF